VAAAPDQTRRDDRASSVRLAVVMVAALRASTAMGMDGVVAVRVPMLGMSVLVRRPRWVGVFTIRERSLTRSGGNHASAHLRVVGIRPSDAPANSRRPARRTRD
jgi:uncharacterized membrane protein YgcG